MPRAARQKSRTGTYHIVMRGVDRRIIFGDAEDCLRFLQTLGIVKKKSGFYLYAYCLMGNHFHLLLKEGHEPLSMIFKRLGSSYVYYYNWKYQLHGHLFQDRFHSEKVEDTTCFLDVMRYICQNPVKAGLSKTLFDYDWMGCSGIHLNDKLLDDIKDITDLQGEALLNFVNQPSHKQHLDTVGAKRLTDHEAQDRLCRACGCTFVQEISGWEKNRRNRAIKIALKSGLSIRQISRLTGISKTIIEKIKKK